MTSPAHGARSGAEAQAPWPSWLSSIPLCCAPLTSCMVKRPGRSKSHSTTSTFAISWPVGRMSDEELLMDQDDEKQPYPVIYDQPFHQPRPVAELTTDFTTSTAPQQHRQQGMVRRASEGGALPPKRRRFWSSSSSRRPLISSPSNFRHISTASPQFPEPTPSRSSDLRPARQLPHRQGFRPLELSMYLPGNRMSPILPHLEISGDVVPQPPPAYAPEGAIPQDAVPQDADADHRLLEHQRSYSSSMSFHLPRKQLDSSPSTTCDEIPAPLIPGKSHLRTRAYTSPDVETIKERVASAMVEVEKLQKQIDDVIERQSLYTVSRPSTAHSMARTMPDLEPMPTVPALPPAAPSFAERLNAGIDRPHTAPINLAVSPYRAVATLGVGEQQLQHNSIPGDIEQRPPVTPPQARQDHRQPPPPLPLVLRPPLRKKKSFSRVSSWLFPGPEQHSRNMSFDSITNAPRPVTGRDGFYQCISLGEAQGPRQSLDSTGTVTSWESGDEDRTVPSTWSPGSTPAKRRDEPAIPQTSTFGKSIGRVGRPSVGVAY